MTRSLSKLLEQKFDLFKEFGALEMKDQFGSEIDERLSGANHHIWRRNA
jgi:hypothetical protein